MAPSPYTAIGWLVIAVAGCAVAGLNGYHVGRSMERSAWQARESVQLAAANAKLSELQTAARDAEQRHAQDAAAVSTAYQKEISNVKTKNDSLTAALRDGSLRLRVPIATGPNACGSTPAEAGASTPGRDGGATAELSDSAAEFLLDLTSEADAVVHQLTACQGLVRADRGL